MTGSLSDASRFDAGGPSLAALVSSATHERPVQGSPALDDGERCIPLCAIADRVWVQAPHAALAGRNLLILTRRPLSAALALVSLDGVAARLVLAPPDLGAGHLPAVVADAAIDGVVHDGIEGDALLPGLPAHEIAMGAGQTGCRLAGSDTATQWTLFTSGTSGAPKMVVHSLAGLLHAIPMQRPAGDPRTVWGTFYDIRRYGGLQMLLRALTGGYAMQLTAPGERMAGFLERLALAGATHISGTPSHWRRALMHPEVSRLSPRYVRLSGEIADQALLSYLASVFPNAGVFHAYASTEAGVGFEVSDGLEGFPAEFLDRPGHVEMRARNGSLQIRSPRTAWFYLGDEPPKLRDEQGFVDTGDLIEKRGDRFYFIGRASGVINVGGLKVHPEEVEAVINRCPGVRMAKVMARRNPVLGAVVAAEVVLLDPADGEGDAGRALRAAILDRCRVELAAHKAPATLKFVASLAITAGGKQERRNA